MRRCVQIESLALHCCSVSVLCLVFFSRHCIDLFMTGSIISV